MLILEKSKLRDCFEIYPVKTLVCWMRTSDATLTLPFLEALQGARKKFSCLLHFPSFQQELPKRCPYFGALAKFFAGTIVVFLRFL